jgi:uridine kinase
VLLFDGVFLQCPELADSWDFRIWVEAPFDVTVPRAVRRDAAGHDERAVALKYRSRYVPGQIMYLKQCDPRDKADVVVDNSDFDHPDLRFLRGV